MTLLQNARPVSIGSGEQLVRVKHEWPISQMERAEHDFYDGPTPRKKRFHYVPSWVFEDENPVSAIARVACAYLCNRGMLNNDRDGKKRLSVWVSQRDIGEVLSVTTSTAARALCELEELGIISIDRPGLKGKTAIFSNTITYIEDPQRWSNIKQLQREGDNVQRLHTAR